MLFETSSKKHKSMCIENVGFTILLFKCIICNSHLIQMVNDTSSNLSAHFFKVGEGVVSYSAFSALTQISVVCYSANSLINVRIQNGCLCHHLLIVNSILATEDKDR